MAANNHDIGYVAAILDILLYFFNKAIKNIILIPQKLNNVIIIGGIDIPIPLILLLEHSKITYKK